MALQVMLENTNSSDPPIIIAAQTNHALDQLLRHVSKFDPKFIRLGAMTKDFELIKPRTLYEIKGSIKPGRMPGGLNDSAHAKMKGLILQMTEILGPLTRNEEVHTVGLFKQYKILSEAQCQSLVKGARDWVSRAELTNEMAVWLGDERTEFHRISPEDLGFEEVDEEELDLEQLKETEAETKVDDEDFETLRGTRVILSEKWTGRDNLGLSQKAVEDEVRKKDLWTIPREGRGPVYKHLQRALKQAIRAEFGKSAEAYDKAAEDAKIGRFEVDYNYLQDCRIIGVTTTGLGKYRALLQSLEPKIVLIEEAAETLEAYATIACLPSLQQLILVGDHAQLRGSPNDQDLSGPPFFLDVSLLERMVRNHMEYTQLNVQRRMIPEIRRLVSPIYPELGDHPSVVHEQRQIPGMAGVNSFFFSHDAPESSDDAMSKLNHYEARMLCHFFVYLIRNGMQASEITVLTGYQGQRRLILKTLRGLPLPLLKGKRFYVETVDSYQGEENDIVLLSLVRSNGKNKIGFLASENRTCVALSRARRGFYIFGNAKSLCKSSMLWWYVVQRMATEPRRVGFHLPVTCSNHNNTTYLNGESSELH